MLFCCASVCIIFRALTRIRAVLHEGVVDGMEGKEVLSQEYVVMILTGILTGMIARVITLYVDYRQTPTYPNGLFNNLVTGFVASALGAVAIPALIEQDFTAITFLALATQHFRDIRKTEGESLAKLDHVGYTKRGPAYIDGIAKTYEARHYVSLAAAVAAVLCMNLLGGQALLVQIAAGVAAGLAVTLLIKHFTKGKAVGDICTIKEGKIRVEGSELYVDDMFVTSVLGTTRSKDLFLREGIAVVVTPKSDQFRVTLDSLGQRQAMLFEACRSLGVKRFQFTRKNYKNGVILIAIVPIVRDVGKMIHAVANTPILENSRKIRRIMTAG